MHAVVPYSSQQAGGAQSRTIPYRSRRFGIGSSLGYAAFEWLGSTWGLRGWSQQPPGITPMPATQPLSKRPLRTSVMSVLVNCMGAQFTLLCVPKTSSALISRKNRLTSAHHDRAAVFRNGRLGRAIQVEEPA